MKQHPDRQPRRAIAMDCSDDDDRQTNQDFEGDWIDGVTPERTKRKERKSFRTERLGFVRVILCVLCENLCALCG
jgi:hypothetical protein